VAPAAGRCRGNAGDLRPFDAGRCQAGVESGARPAAAGTGRGSAAADPPLAPGGDWAGRRPLQAPPPPPPPPPTPPPPPPRSRVLRGEAGLHTRSARRQPPLSTSRMGAWGAAARTEAARGARAPRAPPAQYARALAPAGAARAAATPLTPASGWITPPTAPRSTLSCSRNGWRRPQQPGARSQPASELAHNAAASAAALGARDVVAPHAGSAAAEAAPPADALAARLAGGRRAAVRRRRAGALGRAARRRGAGGTPAARAGAAGRGGTGGGRAAGAAAGALAAARVALRRGRGGERLRKRQARGAGHRRGDGARRGGGAAACGAGASEQGRGAVRWGSGKGRRRVAAAGASARPAGPPLDGAAPVEQASAWADAVALATAWRGGEGGRTEEVERSGGSGPGSSVPAPDGPARWSAPTQHPPLRAPPP
jgi:hypothetical protein